MSTLKTNNLKRSDNGVTSFINATTRSTVVRSNRLAKEWKEGCKTPSRLARARIVAQQDSVIKMDREALMGVIEQQIVQHYLYSLTI